MSKQVEELCRIGIAVPGELLERFDRHIAKRGYRNRSEAYRDLMRDELLQESVESPNTELVGTVTLVYDHHVRLLPEKLTEMQHQHHRAIVSTLHVHLDHHACLEVIVLRGKSKDVRQIANLLISTKGVQHGKLVLTASGSGAPAAK